MNALGLSRDVLAAFCAKHHVERLRLFGSVLKAQARAASDVDLLVEFEPGREPGLIALSAMEEEMSILLGKKADLRTEGDLSRYFRDEVAREAEVQFAR